MGLPRACAGGGMKPTDFDWEMMVFCQRIAHAVRRSSDLRLPRNPEWTLKEMRKVVEPKQGRLF